MFIYLRPRLLSILVLGFVSGLPLALTMSTLTVLLTEHEIQKSVIGLFAAVGIPYAFKFVWSPLIDNINLPFFTKLLGRRRGWLIFSQLMLGWAIVTMGMIDPVKETYALAMAALAVAFLSATQDIVIDAFRIELLKQDEQGAGAAAIVFGYRIGMLASGAGALYLASFYSWETTYMIMGLLLIPGMITVLANKEPTFGSIHRKRESWLHWLKISFVDPFAEFTGRYRWFVALIFIIFYKLSDAYLGIMTNPFLLEMGFTKIEIANIVKTFGLVATLLGAFIGGYIIERIGMYRSLLIGGILQVLSNLAFIWQAYAGHDVSVLMAVISIENLAGGIGTAALVAYLSNLCNINFTATQYALLSSFASFARTTVSASSGYMAESAGWVNFFLFSAVLSIPAVILVKYIFKKDEKKVKAVATT